MCGWWNFLVIVRSYYTLRGRKMQLRTRKDKGRGLAKKGGWSGQAGALRRFAQRRIFPREFAGARGEAMRLFSGRRGCFFRRRSDVHRFALCRKAPAFPKGGSWRAASGAAEAVASLPVRLGGMGDFGRDGVRWEGGRRSLRSLAAGAGMDGSVRWTVGAAGGGARCPPEVVVIRCF